MAECALPKFSCVCVYCGGDASALRVACAECPDFDLCVECFSYGAEIGQHKRTHAFYLTYYAPLFASDPRWTAFEELNLLRTVIEQHYGNWKKVSEKFVYPRTPEEIEKHFHQLYVDGDMGKALTTTSQLPEIQNHTTHFTVESDLAELRTDSSSVKVYSKSGYAPRRGEFVVEYDDNAEVEGGEMLTFEDDDNLYCALKSTLSDMMRERVQKRQMIKKVLLDYDLIKKFEGKATKSPQMKLDREENALREKYKLFCRFMPAASHDQFIAKMMEEQKIKAKIKELQAKLHEQYSKDSLKDVDKTNSVKGKPKACKQKKSALSASSSNVNSPSDTEKKETSSDANSPETEATKEETLPDSAKEIVSHVNYENFLSKSEKKLCANLNIDQACYIALKATILKDRSILKENESANTFPKDMNDRVQKVANFMEKSGWIPHV